ncbi:hypothetical protein GM418_27975 [Maribellus comscasis]|uniref:Uncharacterized protein n=1 Tax=Maribellus comscasis TaxID=2681766 RepID=A0A6I6K428_9BACT|nr:hypothetical protein [Maribellus comscasis]QGY47367.1 hypothetical protein GM418_27975 [Maribellus comscasis]
MKKLGIITIGFVLLSWQLFAQDNSDKKNPDEQIIVNKKYDKNGNLIQFDSTYVHQWSSDSTFQFSFPDNDFFAGNDFPDIDEFFKNFMGDSAIGGFGFSDGFGQMPFGDEEFFKQFHGHFPDSMMMGTTPFDTDSSTQYFYFNEPGNLPPGLNFPGFEEFEKQLNEHLRNFAPEGFEMPRFKNEEQQKEWQELIEKHKKEMEELKKKWEESQ